MASRVQLVKSKGLIHPPKWLPQNVHYEVLTGSVAYGVSSDTSDMDVIGFAIPPKEVVFPHLAGEIQGFGAQKEKFGQWQEHHVQDGEQEYDFTIYNIVKFFDLVMTNNPNMVDSIFVPQRCVLYCSQVGQIVRDNRKLFLHKGSYHKFRGYAYAQLHKMKAKLGAPKKSEELKKALKKVNRSVLATLSKPEDIPELDPAEAAMIVDYMKTLTKRQLDREVHGYSTKFAYHVVRLALEGEQILSEQDLNIEQNSEILKSIRKGEWSTEKITKWFDQKESHLEELYHKSSLRSRPDEDAIKNVLLMCLEQHYGSLDKAVSREVPVDLVLRDLQKVLDKYA